MFISHWVDPAGRADILPNLSEDLVAPTSKGWIKGSVKDSGVGLVEACSALPYIVRRVFFCPQEGFSM